MLPPPARRRSATSPAHGRIGIRHRRGRENTMKRERLITFATLATAVVMSACEQPTLPTTITAGSPSALADGDARFKSFRVPTANSQPRQITLGSDGNMWFTESAFDVSQIGVVDPDGN